MNYQEFLTHCIDDGIAGCKKDYASPEQKDKLEGSIAGFEACRGLLPDDLSKLLGESHKQAQIAMESNKDKYWYYRCYQLEVEWVCNVVGAMMWAQGVQHNFIVTARGTLRADEILKRDKAVLN